MSVAQLRHQPLFRFIAIALCISQCAITLSGCGRSPTSPSASAREAPSGEELYRGVFFGQGDIASKVTELQVLTARRQSLEPSQRVALDEFVDKLAVAIREGDPGFFAEFAREVQSGDHVRISRSMDRAQEVTLAALDRIPEVADWRTRLTENQEAVQAELIRLHNAGRLTEDDVRVTRARISLLVATKGRASSTEVIKLPEPGWDFAIVIAIAAVVVFPPALAVALAVVWAYAYVTQPAGGVGTLTRDRVVDALATRLAVPSGR